MNRLRTFFNILILGCLMASFSGCADDTFRMSGDSMAEGEALVSLQAEFSPFAGGVLSRASDVAPARGFNEISDIAILVFSDEGILQSYFAPENYKVTDIERPDSVASNQHTAETETKSVTGISFKIPSGTYYIVAVANYGEYALEGGTVKTNQTSLERLEADPRFVEGVFTLDNLLSLRVKWDVDEYVNNRAMLGYFTSGDSPSPHSGSKFETVTIDRPYMSIRAWIRRCASKITVDFDGSSLRDNISIYIKDVRIYDIASDCSLGFGNPESDEENRVDFNNHPADSRSPYDYVNPDPGYPEDYPLIYNDGSFIEFGTGNVSDNWPCITRQNPHLNIKDENGAIKDLHSQDAECLYFYENMQGTVKDYNRAPVPDLATGGVFDVRKDGVPFGTYIEVTALHRTEENGEKEDKLIKYRFMLGKNVTDNFDAERNYHYKLTLSFLGSADEYHWHIDYDYDFEEGFKVPNPWYVSYVYNHDAYLPFEFNLSEEWEIEEMTVKVVSNPWYPTTSSSYEGVDEDLTDPEYEITASTPDGDDDYPYQSTENKSTGNGFLSLRQPLDKSELTDTETGVAWSGYDKTNANKFNQGYYDGEIAGTGVRQINHGKRVIISDAQAVIEDTDTEREKISVKRKRNIYSINIPLFTREKNLVTQTGYTGNNPFVGYQRVAKLELYAKVRKIDDHSVTRTETAKVNVVQVRRVVNPKGIYRRSDNFEPFHVNLKFLTSERSDGEFQSIISRGPWMAEVLGDNNFITLDGRQRVSGTAGTNIDFTIRFNRMAPQGNKNAIVRIKYHNYTCTHLIFVRQGYAAQTLCAEGPIYSWKDHSSMATPTVWNTFNMIAGNKMADDPRDEGSLFKYGNYWQAISSVNNIYTDGSGKPVFYEQSKNNFLPRETFTILDKEGNVVTDTATWVGISHRESGFVDLLNDDGTTPMGISYAARMRDFEQLYLTKHIEFGYGVLYADGASDTQSSLEMVNGWYRGDPSEERNKKGMRGVFAYYWNPENLNDPYNGRNIFFPIGRSGYGHRKSVHEELNPNGNMNGTGILRYSSNRAAPSAIYDGAAPYFQTVSPLFEFLYRRMGAIYWTRSMTSDTQYLMANGKSGQQRGCGLDLNYFTFDVNAITNVDLDYGKDACFVRTVVSGAWPK